MRGSGEKTKQKLDIHQYKAKLDLEKELNALEHDRTILHREVFYMRNNKDIERQKIKKGFEEKVEVAKTEANQKISMIQEAVAKFEYDMSQNQERFIMDTQDMNGLLDATKKDLDSLKEMDFDESIDIELKPNLLHIVSMSNDTFMELKKRAEVTERMQRALKVSEQRVQKLENDNKQKNKQLDERFDLRMENSYLKRQVEFFKQVIDKILHMLSAQKDDQGKSRVSKK